MTNITRVHHALPLSTAINQAVTELDRAIAQAVDAAKAAGLPQGSVVSLLHGHAQLQTHIMVSRHRMFSSHALKVYSIEPFTFCSSL